MILFAKVLNIRWLMDAFCFYGGGKGGGGPNTTYTQTLAPELVPYAKDIAKQAQRISAEEYIPYEQERIAPTTATQRSALEQTKQMGPSQYFPAAGLAALQSTQAFGAPQAQTYMSPYQQAVTDIAKREATTEGQQMLQKIGSDAARSGAFGGSRHGLLESQQYSDLAKRLSDLQTRGSQAAFENAQAQFERDRAARARGAQLLGGLGTSSQAAELQRLGALERAGTLEQAEQQRLMDLQYQDFLRQRDFPKEQLGFYSSMVRGIAPMMPSMQYAYTPPPSPFQQALGLGLTGLGAYQMFKG